jgi:branched-chain amino acid transport system ATP-binding protein
MPLLEVRDLEAGYGPIRALDRVSLDVDEGELVAIIGANGAGKTTLLMAISGVVPSRAGSIRFSGRDLAGIAPHEIMRLGVGHAPEGRRIFPRLTVRENLELGGFTQTDRGRLQHDIAEACGMFPVLGKRLGQLGGTLSGGEQQMLAIARALMARPQLLLLDEPSLGIAPKLVQQIFQAIRAIAESGVTIMLVEQNTRIALQVSHRAYVLRTGEIALSGPSKELAANKEVQAAYLGG